MTVILNPQNKRGTASFVASLVKNANTIFVLLSPHVWPLPFSSCFRHPGNVQYTFLKVVSEAEIIC